MKPSNFPARKEARRQAAHQREAGHNGITAREVYENNERPIQEARKVRSKRRSAA